MRKSAEIDRAVAILRAGGVVGMPTETVYGLAADARDSAAVSRVFSLKGRPATNPLIVHVANVEVGARYAAIDERARALFERFAPGPLTVVLPLLSPSPGTPGGGQGEGSRESTFAQSPPPDPLPEYKEREAEWISPLVTAGLNTVGIRIPNHPVAMALLTAFDGPLAAPSANRSNHVSPTTAEHVRDEFGEAVFTLDGGACDVGIESTVVTLATQTPTILRPGAITRSQIEAVVGPVAQFEGHVSKETAAASPGQHEKHYAPRAPAFRFDAHEYERVRGKPGEKILVTLDADSSRDVSTRVIGPSVERAMRELYSALREADERGVQAIYIEMPPDEARWAALRDRVRRATRPISEARA